MHYGKHITKNVPQSEQADERQKQNNAGGFSFTVDKWGRLQRFLVLGSENGTYYATERKLTKDNAKNVLACLDEDPRRAVEMIVEVSVAGRAPKNDPAVFALALAASHKNQKAREAALAALPRVCRIGTHLFHFAREVESQRGWGKALRRAFSDWYSREADKVAYDMVKYQQRDGWSHKDILRLSHATPVTPQHAALFRYIVAGSDGFGMREVRRSKAGPVQQYEPVDKRDLPFILEGFEKAKSLGKSPKELATVIREYGLTHEMIPTEAKNHLAVWEALVEKMPMTALVRNLGKLTQIGIMNDTAQAKRLAGVLTDQAALKKARVHPLSLLNALGVYQQGHGDKGKLIWSPNKYILTALDEAFYLAFGTVEPTGKRTLLALDVSGSMSGPALAGMTGVTPRTGSAAMAMVTARAEKDWSIVGFTSGSGGYWDAALTPLKITPSQRLEDIVKSISNLPFGGTDCALPMVWAKQNKAKFDTFVVYTDNETWAGKVHPHQALKDYRMAMGIPAKLIVVGMTSTEFTIADPSDTGMLDVVGFDTAAPNVMSEFARS